MPRLLWLFSLVNLIIGSGAFVIGGIPAPIAQDLQVGIPAAWRRWRRRRRRCCCR